MQKIKDKTEKKNFNNNSARKQEKLYALIFF